MVRVVGIDRVSMFQGFVSVAVLVVARRHHEHTGERHGEGDDRGGGELITVYGPRQGNCSAGGVIRAVGGGPPLLARGFV